MRKTVILLSILLTASAGANVDMQTLNENHCQKGSFAGGDGRSLTNAPLFYQDGPFEFALQKKKFGDKQIYELTNLLSEDQTVALLYNQPGEVRDFAVIGDSVWTVGTQGLREFDMSGNLLGIYSIPQWEGPANQMPRGFYFHPASESFFIASGRAGLVRFNTETKGFLGADMLNVQNANGHHSAVVAVEGDGRDNLWIAMTGNSEKGFDGLLVYSVSQARIINKSEYTRRAGVVYPFASIYQREHTVYLNNGGWIHAFDKTKLLSKKTIMPKWMAIQRIDENTRQYIMIDGDLYFGDGQILGCGSYLNPITMDRILDVFFKDI